MALSFVKAGAVAGTRTQAVIDLTGGTAIASGDLLIWEVVHSQGDASGQLTPASGTRLTTANGLLPGAASAHWAGYEVLDGTETTINMDMNFAAGTGSAVGWQVWRGAAETSFTLNTNFWEVGSSSASTTMVTSAFNVPAGGTAIAMFGNDGSSDQQYTLAAMTERFNGHGLTATFLNVTGYSEDLASQQTGITRTATFASSQNHAAFVFVITPASAGGDPAVDANASIDIGEDFRLRFELQEINSAYAEPPGFLLYASKNSGAYAQVTGATDLRVVTTAAFTDGDATTNLLTGSTGTFIPGAGDTDGTIGPVVIESNGHTEVEWALRLAEPLPVSLQPTTAPQTFAHTSAATVHTDTGVVVDAGTLRTMAVLVQGEGNDLGADVHVDSITYGGVALTKLASVRGNNWTYSEIWYLVAPAVGSASLVTTLSLSDVCRTTVLVGHEVNQSTPLRTAATSGGGASSGTSASATVTGVVANDLPFDGLSIDGTGHSAVVGADQTSRASGNVGANSNEQAVSTQLGSAGGAMSWTWTTAAPYSHIASAFIAATPATVDGDTFDVRVYRSDGTPLDAYGNTPRITAVAVPTDPAIGLSTTSFTFNATEGGGNPSTRGLTITNTGAGTLNWSGSDDGAWLSLSPTSGALAADASEIVTVSATTGALTPGTYNATITITDAGATNSPQTVAVTFSVSAVTGFPIAIEGVYQETSNSGQPIMLSDGTIVIDREDPKAVPTTQEQEEHHWDYSTDGGHTWTRDVGDIQPLASYNRDLESLCLVLDPHDGGQTIHTLHQKSGFNTTYNRFRVGTHPTNPWTWQIQAEIVLGAQSLSGDQSAALAVRSDGTVVGFFRADDGSTRNIFYKIRSTGGVWGTAVKVSTEATRSEQVFCQLSAQDDTIHIVYFDRGTGDVSYRTLSPTDTLSGPTVIGTGAGTGASGILHAMANNGLVLYNNAGTDTLFCAWSRQSDNHLVGCEIVGGTPGSVEVISDAAVWVNPVNVTSNQPVGCLAYDPTNGDLYAFYSLNSDHDLRRKVRPLGGAWDTETAVTEATADVQAVQARVYTHNATNGGDRVVGLYYDVDIGVLDEGRIEFSEVFLAAGGATQDLAGTSTGSSTTTGDLVVEHTLAGTSAGTSTTTGALTVAHPLAGTSAGTSSTAGAINVAHTLAGTTAGTSTTTGDLAVQHPLAGTSAGTSTTTGSLSNLVPLAGTSTGTSTSTGTLSNLVPVAGTSAGTSATTGDLTVAHTLTGTSAGASTSTGNLIVAHSLAGTSASTSTTTGDITLAGQQPLAGTSTGTSTSTGALTVAHTLNSTSTGTSSSTGNLTVAHTLDGTSAGTSTTTGTLSSLIPLAGNSTGTSTSTGAVVVTRGLAGTSAGTSSTTGAPRVTWALAGATAGTSTTTGALRAVWALTGLSAGASTDTGDLTIQGAIQPVGLLEIDGWASTPENESTATNVEMTGGVLALIE